MIDTNQKLLLDILSHVYFGKAKPRLDSASLPELLNEARSQTVLSAVFSSVKGELAARYPEDFPKWNQSFFADLLINTNNFAEHSELHALMTKRGIPYVVLKGISSASYYPSVSLRDMGDVDFLLNEADIERAAQALSEIGFTPTNADEEDTVHIVFHREPMGVWEMHRSLNGIPSGKAGKLIAKELSATISTAQTVCIEGNVCRIPDKFHHGLIILLHTIAHLTGEGVGLRHLCDWAVFVNSFSEDEFPLAFEEKLTKFGIWKFAQILTIVCVDYLGINAQPWAESVRAKLDGGYFEAVLSDILTGGNFGKKDLNRYREIKYISNRGERTIDDKNMAFQLFSTLTKKVYLEHSFIKRHRFLLPVGWLIEGIKYIFLLITGKRKNTDTSKMLKEASERKSIYSQMELFDTII